MPRRQTGGSAVRGCCFNGFPLACKLQLERFYSRVGLPCRARHWLRALPLVTPSPRSRRSWRARLILSSLSSLMGPYARRPSMVRHRACFQTLLHSKCCRKNYAVTAVPALRVSQHKRGLTLLPVRGAVRFGKYSGLRTTDRRVLITVNGAHPPVCKMYDWLLAAECYGVSPKRALAHNAFAKVASAEVVSCLVQPGQGEKESSSPSTPTDPLSSAECNESRCPSACGRPSPCSRGTWP